MILKDKTILIMGIRNKWSIAYGAAKSAYDQGAKLVFTFNGEENREKVEELLSEFKGFKAYTCDASSDEDIEKTLKNIKQDYGKIDGILHSIAHANTEDLRNDFILTSKDGFSHANDVSAYSLVAISRIARDIELLNQDASIVALTYYGSTKVLPGYNVMGVAKAALECSVRYLADNLGPSGIRVNAISAGPIKTLSAKGIKDFSTILNVVEEKAPLRRNVTTEEVGNSVAFLMSDMSRAITGQIIYADSGYNIMGI
jgi:enoyl-[acyl-carrier protein] reductase I